MILRKEIYASVCCFLLVPGVGAAHDSGVHGDSWSLQMRRSGDGPVNVESEHSRFDENGVVETKKESGELAVDPAGKVYIKKNDGENREHREERVVPGSLHRPEKEEFHAVDRRVRDEVRDARVAGQFNERDSRPDFSDHPIAQRIEQELLEIRELIARDVSRPPKDDLNPSERYHIVKKKLKKIKKLSRALFGFEKKHFCGNGKFKESCPWYRNIFHRDSSKQEENSNFGRTGHSWHKMCDF
ncbi:MAG: hypothetical protein LBF54_03760 [Holosporaceae bacterium]|nr:hypothetical protein [Holosporaceae bacterium]